MHTAAPPDLPALLRGFVESGGWVNTQVFGLKRWELMGGGAVALNDIPSDTPLFHVPNDVVLSPFSSDLQDRLSTEEWERLVGWSRLILVMMWETSKGEGSKWGYYLANSPTEFDTPMFWSSEQLQELIGTDIEDRVGKESAEREYEQTVVPILAAHPELFDPASPHFTLSAYHMQGSRILSRSFTVPSARATSLGGSGSEVVPKKGDNGEDDDSDDEDDDPGVAVMIPIADMLNAEFERNNAHLIMGDEEDVSVEEGIMPKDLPEGFTMVSTEEIKRDEQIINTYSSPPNSELLRKYGHVDILPLDSEQVELLNTFNLGGWPFGNPGDEVGLDGDLILGGVKRYRVGISAALSDEECTERIDHWLEEGHDDTFYLNLSDSLDTQLVGFIKILINDDEWKRFKAKGKIPRATIDGNVRKVLDTAIDERLSKYRQGLTSDVEALVHNTIQDEHCKRATVVRVGEKRILHLAKCVVHQAAELVDGSESKKRKISDGMEDIVEGGGKRRS